MSKKLEDLESVIGGFAAWTGQQDRDFEDFFLRPRLEANGWTIVRFCGGSTLSTGTLVNRTVQCRKDNGERKDYKWGRS